MTGFWQDLRYAYRMLIKSPGFTAVVVVAMGLGIGCTTMIFSVVNAVLLKPLPMPQSDRIVAISTAFRDVDDGETSYPDFRDIRERVPSLEKVAGFYKSQAYLTLGTEPERFNSAAITPGMLSTLGLTPSIGREFLPEEGEDGKQFGSVLISHRIWKERLGANPNVLGRTFRINGRVRTVVGVLPPGARFPEAADFWIPLASKASEDTRDVRYVDALARLAPGHTLEGARAELATLSRTLAHDYPATNQGVRLVADLYHDKLTRDVRPAMGMLMAAVVFVLLIACANVANLMLARAIARQREIGLRSALGAGRGRIARQLFTESLMISLAGALLGVLIAYWSNDLVLGTIPIELPYWMRFGIDGQALAFTVVLAVGSGLFFGLAPVLHLSRGSLHESLKEGGSQLSSGRGHHRMRSALVIAEIALSLVLLAGAGLMIRSFLRMQDIEGRIDPQGVLTGRVTLPVAVYPNESDRRDFFREMLPRIEALPGVVSAAATGVLPYGDNSWNVSVVREGHQTESLQELPKTNFSSITPGFFSTLRIPLVKGRDLTRDDGHDSPRVAIVNQSAARLLWPGEEPIGKHFKFRSEDTLGWCSVVGVVADVRQNAREKKRLAAVFVPHAQSPNQSLYLVVRTRGNAAAMATPIRQLIQRRDRDLPFYETRTMPEAIHLAMWEPRLYAALMAAYALIALVIAAVGIYGVMAYNVAQRTREIGIRMAMGAERGSVLRMVVGQGMRLAAVGLGIGLAVAFLITRLMASLLFGVSASDPPTFLGVIAILAGSALLACWLPAHRATRVDPMVALRSE